MGKLDIKLCALGGNFCLWLGEAKVKREEKQWEVEKKVPCKDNRNFFYNILVISSVCTTSVFSSYLYFAIDFSIAVTSTFNVLFFW